MANLDWEINLQKYSIEQKTKTTKKTPNSSICHSVVIIQILAYIRKLKNKHIQVIFVCLVFTASSEWRWNLARKHLCITKDKYLIKHLTIKVKVGIEFVKCEVEENSSFNFKKHNFSSFSVGVFVLGELSWNCHYLNLETTSASTDKAWIFLDKQNNVSIHKCLASLFLLLWF